MHQNRTPVDYSYHPLEPHHLGHDLRGPLNSVLGFTELMLDGIEGPLTDMQVEDIAAIRQSAQNLLQLINTYVDLSRINAGLLNIDRNLVQVDDIVQMAVNDAKKRDAAAGVELITAVPDSIPYLLVDSNRALQMVLLPVEFLLSKSAGGTIEISAAADGDIVSITISAATVTLAPDQLEELFEQTVRVDAHGRSRLTAGGIFLPLAQQLAHLHNGQLNATSTPETGTMFTLTLPAYPSD